MLGLEVCDSSSHKGFRQYLRWRGSSNYCPIISQDTDRGYDPPCKCIICALKFRLFSPEANWFKMNQCLLRNSSCCLCTVSACYTVSMSTHRCACVFYLFWWELLSCVHTSPLSGITHQRQEKMGILGQYPSLASKSPEANSVQLGLLGVVTIHMTQRRRAWGSICHDMSRGTELTWNILFSWLGFPFGSD